MTVTAIKQYHDLILNKLVNVGEELDVSEARAKVLIDAKVAKLTPPAPTPEVAKEPARKKPAKK